MPDPTTLRVRANAAIRVRHGNAPGYLGQRCTNDKADTWEPAGVVECPNDREHRMSVKAGDLFAADAETAAVCGVKFTAAIAATEKS